MTATTPTMLASDPIGGTLMIADGMCYYVSDCCSASAKGSANSPTGVCCRKCYAPIPAETGMAWMVDDDTAWDAYRTRLEPHVERFAHKCMVLTRDRARSL